MPLPVTPRLMLRILSPADLEDLHAVLSDPVAMKHYPMPFTRPMTQKWIQWNLGNYQKYGFGLWAVILRRNNRFIGDCGLTIQRVDGVDELEVGYHILREYWGRGLATEAAAACRDFAFHILGRPRLIAWMHPENTASRRVAEKIGMTMEKQTTDRAGQPAVVYSMVNQSPV